MAKTNYKTLLQKEAEKRGWTPEQVNVFEQWRNNISQIESNDNPTISQVGGGPGRGKYQYEVRAGKGSGSNIGAISRLKKYLKANELTLDSLPAADKKVLNASDPDFSKLSADTQDIIFLADKTLAARTSLNDLVTGKIDQNLAWAKWHWKGSNKDLPAKLEQWDRNVGSTPIQGIPSGMRDYEEKFTTYSDNPKVSPDDLRDYEEKMVSYKEPEPEPDYVSMEELLGKKSILSNPFTTR